MALTGLSKRSKKNEMTDWAAEYRRKLALQNSQKAVAQGVKKNVTRSLSSGAAPTTKNANKGMSNSAWVQGSTPTSSGVTSPVYTGAPQDSYAPGGAPPGGTPTTGGGAEVTPPNETPPGSTRPKDQSYSFDWQKAWGNNKGITANSDWANTISDTMLDQVLSDPEQASAQWASSKGYGQGIEGALNQYADPTALAMLSAEGLLPPTGSELAGFIGGFNDSAIQSTGGRLINPRGVIQRVLSASGDAESLDALGSRLYGINASNPYGQVADTLKFLQSALTGTMPKQSLDTYLYMLERMGREFLQWKSTPEGVTTATNFGKFILDKTGGTGGL